MKQNRSSYLVANFIIFTALICTNSIADTKREYENRLKVMVDFAVRLDDFVRSNLGDKKLAAYAQVMSEKNASEAERMTPPENYLQLHPHFLLALENIERSFYYASKGDMSKYREYQKRVRKELQLLEGLAEKENCDLYIWRKRF